MSDRSNILPTDHERSDTRSWGVTISDDVIEQFKETVKSEYGKTRGVTGLVVESLLIDYIENHDPDREQSVSNRDLMRKLEELEERVDTPSASRSAETKGAGRFNYNPDAYSGTLDAQNIRQILDTHDDPEINPEHLPESVSSWPQDTASKRRVIAAVCRYTTDHATVDDDYPSAVMSMELEMSEYMVDKYRGDVKQLFIPEPVEDEYWVRESDFREEYEDVFRVVRMVRMMMEMDSVDEYDDAVAEVYNEPVTPDNRYDAVQSVLDVVDKCRVDVLNVYVDVDTEILGTGTTVTDVISKPLNAYLKIADGDMHMSLAEYCKSYSYQNINGCSLPDYDL